MNLSKRYTMGELAQLRAVLYDILKEIVRVCDKHDIDYFAIGGTAIGALYEQCHGGDFCHRRTKQTILPRLSVSGASHRL